MFDGSLVALNILFIVFYCFNQNVLRWRVVFCNVRTQIDNATRAAHAFQRLVFCRVVYRNLAIITMSQLVILVSEGLLHLCISSSYIILQ
jgi:hypothetical protein